jgi:hypothetical protein
MSLVRVCLGCGRKVRGRSWCPRCWTAKEQTRSEQKRQRRPDLYNDHAERMRRAASSPTTAPSSATGAPGGSANHPTPRPT